MLAADFWGDVSGGFFLTAGGHDVPLGWQKPETDGALPSGNAVAVMTLLRLAEFTGDDAHRVRADATLRALAPGVTEAPTSAPSLLTALDFRLDRPKEIVIVRASGAPEDGAPLLAAVHAAYVPNRVQTVASEGRGLAAQQAVIPFVEGKRALDGAATAYVCERHVCDLPTGDPAVLAAQLARVAPLPADGAD